MALPPRQLRERSIEITGIVHGMTLLPGTGAVLLLVLLDLGYFIRSERTSTEDPIEQCRSLLR